MGSGDVCVSQSACVHLWHLYAPLPGNVHRLTQKRQLTQVPSGGGNAVVDKDRQESGGDASHIPYS